VQNLLDDNLIIETTLTGNRLGRKSLLIELNSKAGYCINVAIENLYTKIMFNDLCGQKIHSLSIDIPFSSEIIENIFTEIKKCTTKLNLTHTKIIGISLSTRAYMENELDWNNVKENLSTFFNTNVFIHSHGHFAVLGENSYSDKSNNIVFIDNTYDISMGAVIDDRLLLGSNNKACNLANTIINKNGNAILLKELIALHVIMDKINGKTKEALTIKEFLALFNKYDSYSENLINEFIEYTNIAINNVINFYNPEIIVINCPIVAESDEIFIRLKNSLKENKGVLYPSMLKENAPLYGGAIYCIINFLKVKHFIPAKCYYRDIKFV